MGPVGVQQADSVFGWKDCSPSQFPWESTKNLPVVDLGSLSLLYPQFAAETWLVYKRMLIH